MLAGFRDGDLGGRSMLLQRAASYRLGTILVRRQHVQALLLCDRGRVADRAIQIHGASGLMRGSPIERSFRDLRLFRVGEGTSEVQRMVIARDLLRS